jgi:hypothetical protein
MTEADVTQVDRGEEGSAAGSFDDVGARAGLPSQLDPVAEAPIRRPVARLGPPRWHSVEGKAFGEIDDRAWRT